jgi:DNA-binding NtrC family response regulator
MMSDLKLLLVDDELEFLEPLSTRLGRRGIACTLATSGEDALRVLGESAFDCAVVDVKMPGIDGIELLRRMRRDHPRMSVVLLTGHASVELGVQGMELGAFDYLLKPVDLDELLDVVRRATRRP